MRPKRQSFRQIVKPTTASAAGVNGATIDATIVVRGVVVDGTGVGAFVIASAAAAGGIRRLARLWRFLLLVSWRHGLLLQLLEHFRAPAGTLRVRKLTAFQRV